MVLVVFLFFQDHIKVWTTVDSLRIHFYDSVTHCLICFFVKCESGVNVVKMQRLRHLLVRRLVCLPGEMVA